MAGFYKYACCATPDEEPLCRQVAVRLRMTRSALRMHHGTRPGAQYRIRALGALVSSSLPTRSSSPIRIIKQPAARIRQF